MAALAAAGGLGTSTHGSLPSSLLSALSAPGGASSETLAQLEAFIHQLFVLRLGADFWLQGVVALAIIAALILGGSLVILHRIFHQKFWLFKLTRRSEGMYVIPNSLNCFLIFEGAFGLLWIAFCAVQYVAYGRQADDAQRHLAVFNTVVWLPLWIGASLAGWGSFYTAPGALDRGPLSSSKIGHFLPRPYIVNLVCLGTPFLLAASVAAPMALAQRSLNSSFAAYLRFSADVRRASAQAPLGADDTAVLVRQASEVWSKQVRAIDLQGTTFTVWSVWAGLFLVSYIPAGGYLLALVWQQMQRQRRVVREAEARPVEKPAPASALQAGAPLQRPDSITVLSPSGDSLLFQPLNAAAPEPQTGRRGSLLSQTTGSPPVTPRTLVNPDALEKGAGGGGGSLKAIWSGKTSHPPASQPQAQAQQGQQAQQDDSDFFFPPLRPDLRRRAAQRAPQAGSPGARYRYLRRCFINLLLLYVSITLGALAYLIIASVLGGRLSHAIRRGPKEMTDLVYGASCAASWAAVLFGTASFGAIFSRFFDPSHEDAQRTRSRTPARAGAEAKTASDALSPHVRTRPLPAVPESVGATMDGAAFSAGGGFSVSLGGVGSGVGSVGPDGAGVLSVGGEEQQEQLLDGIKFQLRPASDARDGALLMRPVDAAGSAEVSPESTQIGGVGHLLRLGGRRRERRRERERASGLLDAAASHATSVGGEDSQTDSQRSFKAGRTVYYPTPYGHMPAPARGEVMPLPPERSPPPTAAAGMESEGAEPELADAADEDDDDDTVASFSPPAQAYALPASPTVRGWVHTWAPLPPSGHARRASVAHPATAAAAYAPALPLAAYRRRPSAPLLYGAAGEMRHPAAEARAGIPPRSPPPGGRLPLLPPEARRGSSATPLPMSASHAPSASRTVGGAPRPPPLTLDQTRRIEAARLSPGVFF